VASALFQIGKTVIDRERAELSRDGRRLHLRHQSFQTLLYLIDHTDRVLSKDELFNAVWKGAAVSDGALVQCIRDIRRALGDDGEQPQFVQTVPKVGYRLTGVVVLPPSSVARTESTSPPAARIEPAPRARTWTYPILAASLAIAVLTGAISVGRGRGKPAGSGPAGTPVVAVLPFTNLSGDQDIDWLRHGLPDMLITGLARSARFSVLGRSHAATIARRGSSESSSAQEAIALASRAGATIAVVGSVSRMGSAIRIDVHVYSTKDGQLLHAHPLTVNRPDLLLTEVDTLALRVAAALGATGDMPRLTDVMTDNLEAYREYSLALDKADAYDSEGALRLLKHALEIDPAFAMAHARIGYIHAVVRVHEFTRARPHLEAAMASGDRLTPRDRMYIDAWYAESRGDVDAAIGKYEVLLKRFPTETEAHRDLSRRLIQTGRIEESQRILERALAVDPEAKDIWNTIGFGYLSLGAYDRAIAAHERYVALDPLEANAHDSLGITYGQAGRWPDAIRALEKARALRPDFHFVAMHLGDVYAQMGKLRKAAGEYRQAAALAPSDWDRAMAYRQLALALWRRGDTAEAFAVAREEHRLKMNLGTELRLALLSGDRASVPHLRERYFGSATTPAEGKPASTSRERPYLLGLIALSDGLADEALAQFRSALAIPHILWGLDSLESCLGDALAALGRANEAIAEYERILTMNPKEATMAYRLALLHDRAGRQVAARAGYERFLSLWSAADPDLPDIRHAGERLRALAAVH
jgi:DNA-binding winged helix-turn-helix (wHTH) protein/tetratricopeptide (TPR) repeat protein/TolB-like protein